MKKLLLIIFLFCIFNVEPCSAQRKAPTSFVRSSDGGDWTIIELRNDITMENAWDAVMNVVARKFEPEMIDKQSFYVRTCWNYTFITTAKGNSSSYRNRIIYRFIPEKKALELKTDAQFGRDGNWVTGFDSEALSRIKRDIMAVVGKTTM